MKSRLSAILCALVLVSCSCLSAAADQVSEQSMNPSPSPSGGPPQKPYYLTGNEDVWQNFPPKPALGSPTDQTDLLITLSLQASRTEDQKTEAFRDRNYSIKLVTDVIDVNFETQYPNTFKVLNNADIDSYYVVGRRIANPIGQIWSGAPGLNRAPAQTYLDTLVPDSCLRLG